MATERALLADGHLLAHRAGHQVDARLVDEAITEAPRMLGLSHALSDEQASAVRYVTQSGDFAIVEGYAGTGKSTMLAAARSVWQAQGYKVVGGALAGKAADGLADSAGIESRTLASWQWNWERGQLRLTREHVFVIDEAGMVGTSQFAEVVSEVRAAGAKLVVVGDTRQLQAIDPGAPMRLLESRYGAATLSQIVRQRDTPGNAMRRSPSRPDVHPMRCVSTSRRNAFARAPAPPTRNAFWSRSGMPTGARGKWASLWVQLSCPSARYFLNNMTRI